MAHKFGGATVIENSLVEGTLFDERYVIKSVAGRGGMATVYRAFHKGLGRDVALKVLNDGRCATADEHHRFRQEAQLVSLLSHPNITAVNAFGIFEERPYVAFEFLEGVSLAKYIADSTETLPFKHFLKIFGQICDGLQCAHGSNVVHRDLKPENILLVDPGSENEIVKIVDFGIAKALQQGIGKPAQKLTATGSLLGTPLYMSPEQCSGVGVDTRSDIYAVGCIMYYCIMKKPPFDGDSFYQVMYAHGNSTAPQVVPPADYLQGVADIIAKCVAKVPAERYQSVIELRADLDLLSRGCLVSATQSWHVPARKRSKPDVRTKMAALLPLSLLIMSIAGSLILINEAKIRRTVAAFKLEQQWRANDYVETAREVCDALNANDQAFIERVAIPASGAAFTRPTVAAAQAMWEITKAYKKKKQRESEPRRWKLRTERVFRFMPLSEWRKPGALPLLVEVVYTGNAGSAPDKSAALINWLTWKSKIRDSEVQNLIIDYADTLSDERSFPFAVFKDLQGDWSHVGIIADQWLQGKPKSAEHVARIVAEHVTDYLNDEPPSTVYSTQRGRAACVESALLANVGRDNQNLVFLDRIMAEPELQGPYAILPLLIQYAEEKLEGSLPDASLKCLSSAERLCDALNAKDPAFGLTYYPVIGDGYASLGKPDLAMKAYRKVLASNASYQKMDAIGDYCCGRLMYSVSHAYHMLGDDQKALAAAGRAEYMLDNSGKVRHSFRSCFDMWMYVIQSDQYALAGVSGSLREAVKKDMVLAAFHGYAGRFGTAAKQLQHVSLTLHANNQLLDTNFGMPFLAGEVAAIGTGSDDIAEECLMTAVKNSKNGGIKRESRLTLAQLYAKQRRFAEALQLVREAAHDAKDDKERWRISRTRLPIAYASRDWPKVVDACEEMSALSARYQNMQPGQREWVETWQEVYAFCLRQLGQVKTSNELIDKLDTRLSS